MSAPDSEFKSNVASFLHDANLSVEEIQVLSSKTPDLLVNKDREDETLLEIKTKEDDPNFMAELDEQLDSGGVFSYSQPTSYWNRLDGIISNGVKQLNDIDPKRKSLRAIWMHCAGFHADLVEMRLKATMYGTQYLFCTSRPNIVTCFYFWNSTFFKHRLHLDGVIISRGENAQINAQINLNDHSEHFARFLESGLCKVFHEAEAVFYPQQYSEDQDFMFHDSPKHRNDQNITLEYLRDKYRIANIQTFDLGMHAGLMRVPKG